MKKIFIIFFFLFIPTSLWATDYYVRPIAGEYGAEDGSSYAAAFDGFTDIVWGSLGGGDTLFVAGTHSEQLTIGASGTNDSIRLNIYSCETALGASTDDVGIIDGASVSQYLGAVSLNAESYITIDGLTVINTTGSGSGWHEGFKINADGGNTIGITIKNCDINLNDGSGIIVNGYGANYVQNFILEFCDIEDNWGNGILTHFTKTSAIIRYNNFNGNGTSTDPGECVDDNSGGSFYHNIYVDDDQVDGTTYIYGNRIESCLCGQGVKLKYSGDIYWNFFKNNEDYNIMHIEYAGTTSTQRAWANVLITSHPMFNAIEAYIEGNGTITIYDYNNSIYRSNTTRGSGAFGSWDGGASAIDTWYVKNNIIYVPSADAPYYWTNAPTSVTIENNCIYGFGTYAADWEGADKTWVQWNALGYDSPDGMNSDPKYTNVSGDDLTLQSSSPCIDAGEDLGDTFDDMLDPSTSWTLQGPGIVQSSVATLDQDDYGSGWEIGAYVYEPAGGVTGTIIPGGCTESEIVSGGKTIVITISGTTLVATFGADNAVTTAFIDGFDSAQSEAAGWDAEMITANVLTYEHVVRTDANTATVTLPACAAFQITSAETITLTIPATSTEWGTEITATPTFIVSAEYIGAESVSVVYDATGPSMVYDAGGVAITAP